MLKNNRYQIISVVDEEITKQLSQIFLTIFAGYGSVQIMTDQDGPKTYGSYRSGSTTLQIILGKYCSGHKMQYLVMIII
jgi:hypothetical protein